MYLHHASLHSPLRPNSFTSPVMKYLSYTEYCYKNFNNSVIDYDIHYTEL